MTKTMSIKEHTYERLRLVTYLHNLTFDQAINWLLDNSKVPQHREINQVTQDLLKEVSKNDD